MHLFSFWHESVLTSIEKVMTKSHVDTSTKNGFRVNWQFNTEHSKKLHINIRTKVRKKHVTYFGLLQTGKCYSLVVTLFFTILMIKQINIMEVVFFRKRFGDIYLVNSNTLCKVLVTKSYCSLYRHSCGIRMQFFFRYFVHTCKAIYDVLYDLCRFATKILTESKKFLFGQKALPYFVVAWP